MSDRSDPIDDLVHAVDRFTDWKACRLARSVIHRLMRMPATGIFGDDYLYRSVWDEYCHERQFGPHDMLESAWDSTLGPLIAAVLEAVPAVEMAVLDSAEAIEIRNGDMAASIRAAMDAEAMDREVPGTVYLFPTTHVPPRALCRGVPRLLRDQRAGGQNSQ